MEGRVTLSGYQISGTFVSSSDSTSLTFGLLTPR